MVFTGIQEPKQHTTGTVHLLSRCIFSSLSLTSSSSFLLLSPPPFLSNSLSLLSSLHSVFFLLSRTVVPPLPPPPLPTFPSHIQYTRIHGYYYTSFPPPTHSSSRRGWQRTCRSGWVARLGGAQPSSLTLEQGARYSHVNDG